MLKPTRLNKSLWALAYVIGGASGIYGAMYYEGADFETLRAAWRTQEQPQKSAEVSLSASFATALPAVPVPDTESRTEIGPIVTAKDKDCFLSDDDIKSTQDIYNDEMKRLQAQNRNPLQDYSFLLQRVHRMDGCLDNLKVYGWEKKEYLSYLRQAAITEVRNEYRELVQNSDSVAASSIVDRILRVAPYAGISDEGELNVEAGLKAALLPDQASLLQISNKTKINDSIARLNNIRSYTGSEDWAKRHDIMADVTNLRMDLFQNPDLAKILMVSEEELQKISNNLIADDDREFRNERMVQDFVPEPQSQPQPN